MKVGALRVIGNGCRYGGVGTDCKEGMWCGDRGKGVGWTEVRVCMGGSCV